MVQNANRVHHVVGFVKHENFEKTISKLSMALQTSFYGPTERPEIGVKIAISMDAGIELVSPLSNDPASPGYEAFSKMSEGWISVIVAMNDLESACARLEALGYAIVRRDRALDHPTPFAERFERLEEVSFPVEAFGGLPIIIGDLQEK